MNFIINLVGKFIILFDMKDKGAVGLIENDFGLIKYFLKILRRYTVTVDKSGYLKFENKKGEVYVHRIVMEYYAQFDDKLFTILNNTGEYEINHKNKMKWDNRLENLEFVTKSGNQKHRMGKRYDDEIAMSSLEIVEIKNRLMKQKQYQADKKYLEKVSATNKEILNSKSMHWYNDSRLYNNAYIKFNNKTKHIVQISSNIIYINILSYFNNIIFIYLKNTFYTTNYTKSIIQDININYDIYRCRNICKNNIKLLLKYYNKSSIFRKLCNKYKLINHAVKPNKPKKDNKNINYDDYYNIKKINYNILMDLYCNLISGPLLYTFYKNELFISVSLEHIIFTYGKYNSFKVLYYTELLKRQQVYFNPTSHTVSSFLIPEYTDFLFISTILPLSKKIYEQDLTKITHTIIAKNDGLEKAQKIYRNYSSKIKTEKDFISIEDIKAILFSSFIKEKISIYGFITINDIRKELQLLNDEKKRQGLPFREIKDTDNKFITGIVRNTTEIKEILKDLKVEYSILTNKTKEKIKQYQISKNIEETASSLTFNSRVIVLKKLIVQAK